MWDILILNYSSFFQLEGAVNMMQSLWGLYDWEFTNSHETLGHLIDCLHSFLFLETDLTDLILYLSSTRSMMSPEIDLSETSVNLLKRHTAWLSPKKVRSCSSVTDVCSLLGNCIHKGLEHNLDSTCNFNPVALNDICFLNAKGVSCFFEHLAYHFAMIHNGILSLFHDPEVFISV